MPGACLRPARLLRRPYHRGVTLRIPAGLGALLAGAILFAACGEDAATRSPVTTRTPAAGATTPNATPAAPVNPGAARAPDLPGGAATPVTVPPLIDPEAIEAWAVDTCVVLETWTVALERAEAAEAVVGGPASLPLDERLARSARLSAAERAESEAAAAALRAELPPFGIAEYHDAVADQFEARIVAVDALEARLAAVTSAAEFAAATAEYEATLDQRRRVVTAASQFLPSEAIAALTSGSCGYLTR